MSLRCILYLSVLVCVSCVRDDGDTEPANAGYGFFPIAVGTFVEYRADSVYHDQPDPNIPGIHDTTVFFIREVIESEFLDAMGETSLRIERYTRSNEEEEWNLSDVWFAKRTDRNAQKVEENNRFVKLGFPVSAPATWDGNALNTLGPWIYQYDSLFQERTYNEIVFPQTIKVLQRDNKNFVEDELAFEIYAADVGLIYRYFRDLDTRLDYTNFPTAANIRLGVEFKWEILDYGVQ